MHASGRYRVKVRFPAVRRLCHVASLNRRRPVKGGNRRTGATLLPAHTLEEKFMKTLLTMVFAGCVAVWMTGAYAADDMMKKDDMMQKDEMKKDGAMMKDGMKKDGMMKKDEMKKDGAMMKDEMKK